jgi:hypothetical protein
MSSVCMVVRPKIAFLFFSFFSFSFFVELRVGHAKIHINLSIYFFFWFSLSSLIYNCFIQIDCFWLIFFWFDPWSFGLYSLNFYLFYFESFSWLFFLFHPRYLFSFNFYVKFGHNYFNCYFLIILLMDSFCTI